MRTLKYYEYKITKDYDAQGFYNPPLRLFYRDKTGRHSVLLGAGYSDDISVFRSEETTYVLSENTGLGYIGLEAFSLLSGIEHKEEVFFQSEVDEILGKNWENKSDMHKVKCLINYL